MTVRLLSSIWMNVLNSQPFSVFESWHYSTVTALKILLNSQNSHSHVGIQHLNTTTLWDHTDVWMWVWLCFCVPCSLQLMFLSSNGRSLHCSFYLIAGQASSQLQLRPLVGWRSGCNWVMLPIQTEYVNQLDITEYHQTFSCKWVMMCKINYYYWYT